MPRPTSLPRLVVVLGTIAASIGCSLAFGIDASDYTRGTPDAATAHDAASTEAGDASVASPCSAGNEHVLCEDFDHGPVEPRGWSDYGTGARTIDETSSVSPPSSIELSTTSKQYASIERDVGVDPAGDLRVHVDLRIDVQRTGATLAVLAIGTYLVRIGRTADGAFVVDEFDVDAGAQVGSFPSSVVTGGAWTAVGLTVHFVPNRQAGSHATLRLDGRTVVDTALHPTVDERKAHLQVGVCDGPDGDLRIRLDDVYVDKSG